MDELSDNNEIRKLPILWCVYHPSNSWPEIRFVYLDKSDNDWWHYYESLWYNLASEHFKHYTHNIKSNSPRCWFFEDRQESLQFFESRINLEISHIERHRKSWISRLEKEYNQELDIVKVDKND